MVNLHFLNLIEGLQQYSSIVLAKVNNLKIDLKYILNKRKFYFHYSYFLCGQTDTSISSISYSMLIKCLQRLQYKVAMIELQSSNAAQLYNSHN